MVENRRTMKLVLLMVLVVLTNAFPAAEDTDTEEADFPLVETPSTFAALDDVRLIANGLLQLGRNLRDFVQKTKSQINDILQKLTIFDNSFYQLSVLASEIKEEEDELKKTTVVLKANNEEIKSLSLEIKTKVEDVMRERVQLRKQVGGLEEKMSGLSQGLLSADQVAEISALKEVIQVQERSISELLKAVKEQSEHLNYQRNKIKGLEKKLGSAQLQETTAKSRWDTHTYSMSEYLSNYSTDGSFSGDLPGDCGEVFSSGENSSGLYAIKPNQSEPFLVFCEFTEEGAFTIIQRRRDGSVDFNLLWQSYEDGFGDFRSEFWLGLKKILSIARHCQGCSLLRLQMEDWKLEKHSMEFQYSLEGPASNYTIHLREVEPETDFQEGMRFSTKDRNERSDEENCTRDYSGGWWFSACGDINLNGKCIQSRPRRRGVQWKHHKGQTHLKSSKISIHHVTKI
ncbi:angiopoietin-related protein 3-like [Hoplias malabaricus]|uniref:angiopoietin-related protein 3-like n=1 Tax=Hoplias malabaricus TaxID=27720 RepID=UPI0034618653